MAFQKYEQPACPDGCHCIGEGEGGEPIRLKYEFSIHAPINREPPLSPIEQIKYARIYRCPKCNNLFREIPD